MIQAIAANRPYGQISIGKDFCHRLHGLSLIGKTNQCNLWLILFRPGFSGFGET